MSGSNLEVVRDFLQTAVVVDDQAYDPVEPDDSLEEATLVGETLEELIEDASDENADGPHVDVEIDSKLVVKELGTPALAIFTEALVEGFADFGIACSVLKPAVPEQDAQDHNRLKLLAKRADIVVLDWQLTGPAHDQSMGLQQDDGTSISFLTEVLANDIKYGPRFRLICIYTGNHAVHDILERVSAATERILGSAPAVDEEAFSIQHGPLKIVLIAKKRIEVAEGVRSATAAELPRLMVEEFGRLVSTGLMPDLALSALSAVRNGAHQILGRFEGDLDRALISHYSRTGSAATVDFLRGIITDEFSSLIALRGPVEMVTPDNMAKHIAKYLDAGGPNYHVAHNREAAKFFVMDREQASAVLNGSVGSDEFDVPQIGTKRGKTRLNPASLTSVLTTGEDWESILKESLSIDKRLSVLSCMAASTSTIGSTVPPMMQLGTVIASHSPAKESAGEHAHSKMATREFFLCLQPLCDSVRLSDATGFPLIPLKSNHPTKADLFLEIDGEIMGLTISGVKFNQIRVPIFLPEPVSATVQAGYADSDGWIFRDEQGCAYKWAGQVRQWKAQKLASVVANHVDRVGIDEYEYLRKIGS